MSASVPLLQAADPAWPAQFAELAAELAPCLPARAQLAHIGSTAVPGLCAKPVLDLLLGVEALAEVDAALIGALARLGYAYRPAYEAQIPERRYFVREAGRLPRVHLHAVQRGGLLWRAHLGFRDALRDSPLLRDEYAALKQALARQHAGNKSAYTEAKSPFIQRVLAGLPAPAGAPTFFEHADQFRDWLEAHHATATELIVGFRKVGTGRPSLSWSASVDEALCFGWIDGVRKRIDDSAYQIRFTPRRSGSIWSRVNVAKVAQLTAAGRMRPAGVLAFAARREEKTGVYAFEREQPAEFSAAELLAFQQQASAWRYFEAAPPSYRRLITHWVVSAKQAATRERRFAQLVQACAEQRRILR